MLSAAVLYSVAIAAAWGAGYVYGTGRGRAAVWTRFIRDSQYRRAALERLAELEHARVELREP